MDFDANALETNGGSSDEAQADARIERVLALNSGVSTVFGIVSFIAVVICMRNHTPMAFRAYSRILTLGLAVDIFTLGYNFMTQTVEYIFVVVNILEIIF